MGLKNPSCFQELYPQSLLAAACSAAAGIAFHAGAVPYQGKASAGWAGISFVSLFPGLDNLRRIFSEVMRYTLRGINTGSGFRRAFLSYPVLGR